MVPVFYAISKQEQLLFFLFCAVSIQGRIVFKEIRYSNQCKIIFMQLQTCELRALDE